MTLFRGDKTCTMAATTGALLAVSLIGVGLGCKSDLPIASTIVPAAASFLGGVMGDWAFDRGQALVAACRQRPPDKQDENHVILRTLRIAQLNALKQLQTRWNADRATDRDPVRRQASDEFDGWLTKYFAEQSGVAETLTWDSLRAPADADLSASLDADLAVRHGVSPRLDAVRGPVDDAVWAELQRSVAYSVPNGFKWAFDDPDTGFFARFVAEAATALRDKPDFERIWNAEQVATLRHLATTANQTLERLECAVQAATGALKHHGAALDVIAGELRSVRAMLADIHASLRAEHSWLHFKVPLSTEGWLRFSYYNLAIPFQGRTAELATLDTFLNDPGAFKWWAVTGAGGAGKTRLALELCWRAHASSWRIGFIYRAQAGTRIDLPPGWLPTRPTLILVDYAAERVGAVSELALALSTRPETPGCPVRLLMLERQVDDQFWNAFYTTSMSNEGTLKDSQFRSSPLALPDLSEEELWRLVAPRLWQPQPTPLPLPRDRFFARLGEIDRGRRPLVAMLLADAPDLTGDLAAVLRKLLDRERAHWRQTVPAEAPLLIAAATMLGALQGELLTAIETRLGRSLTAEHDLDPCARAIGAPVNQQDRSPRLDSLEPDLIGEFFTLETLRGRPPDPPPYAWLPPLCWHLAPARMATFVLRAVGNFPSHQAVDGLLAAPIPTEEGLAAFLEMAWAISAVDPLPPGRWRIMTALTDRASRLSAGFESTEWLRRSLSAVLFNTLNHAKAEGDTGRRDRLLQDLRDLAAAWPDDPAAREQVAKGLFNTLIDAKAEGDTGRRDRLLQDLRDLAAAWPDDPAGRERLAKGLVNTLIDATAEGDTGRRDRLLQDLRDLAAAWPDDPAVREQVAKGLFNTLNHAKAEGDTGRRDTLLQDLRDLAAAWPDDPAVREQVANGLFNTLNDAKAEGDTGRRDRLLQDLRDLAAAWPDDPAVREQVAMGLFNTLNHAKAEGDTGRRDTLLQDLRDLAAAWPDDPAVRERLAKGLVNTLNDAKAEGDTGRRDTLLQDLRDLAAAWPDDPAVRERLAKGLFNTLNDAKAEGDTGRRDTLLQDLRDLAAAWPDDPAVREQVANGLFNTLNDAKAEGDTGRRDRLLQGLRDLAAAWPDDPAVREQVAMGLFNTLNHAKAEGDTGRRDTLLQDLRDLAAAWPDDPAVREPLAKGLFNTLNDAKAEGDTGRRDTLLQDLRDLAAAWPDDPVVREPLAMGLVNTLNHAKAEGDTGRRDTLLQDLRDLAAAWPDDPAVREPLAKGLFNTLNDAKAEGDTGRRDTLLQDLRDLAAAWPDDPVVREPLAMGLVNTLNHAKAEGDTGRRDRLLQDLRNLAAAWPDDPAVREQVAKGLFNTLNHAKAEGDTGRRDTLLQDLRDLAAAWPDDPAVREPLAMGLGATMLHSMIDGDPDHADRMLKELGMLAGRFPKDELLQQLHDAATEVRRNPDG